MCAGLALSFGVTRWMTAVLVDVNPVDPFTYSVTASGLMVVALIASAIPALRAARVDPAQTMRTD
jgi:putative ABC transport system permease protein